MKGKNTPAHQDDFAGCQEGEWRQGKNNPEKDEKGRRTEGMKMPLPSSQGNHITGKGGGGTYCSRPNIRLRRTAFCCSSFGMILAT